MKNFFDCSMLLFSLKGFSQGPDYGAGMKFNLNEDGSKYLRVISWAQIWGQYNSDRPLDGNGNEQADLDFSVRRARVLLYAQINKDFLILTHIGLNSLNSNTMSPTGTGEGSQVFYMMFGLNTVLVKTMPSEVDYITGTEFLV
jgi:hypothetical protein